MILKIKNSSVVKGFLICFFKQSAVLRRNKFTLSEKYLNLYLPRSYKRVTFFNSSYISKCFDSSETTEGKLDKLTFENICTETLDSLTEYFEELVESTPHLKNADVTYSDGVLTVHLGKGYGTYVINRQTPNLQIWLSSPISGPKRYDFLEGTWVYKHDKSTLHSLLNREIKEIVNHQVLFVEKCLYAKNSI